MKRPLRRSLFLGLLALALAALAVPKLVSFDAASGPPPSAAAEDGEAPPLPVEVHRVAPERLAERLTTSGTLRADERVEVVSEVAGKVERILFAEGSRVAAGQVLVEVDDRELTARLDQAHHRVELARQQERRQRQLASEGIISQEEYDQRRSQLEVLEAEHRLIETQLAKTKIRAPFAGVIGLRRVSPGAYLSPGALIATLQDLDPIKVDFSLPEQYAGVARVGGEVDFSVKGAPGRFRARIYAIEPAVDPETRSLLLRAESPNPGAALLPGAFADVEVVLREVPDALTVPAIAVVPELGGKKVFVVEEGRARARAVETGIRTGTRVEILSGLEAGDEVITSGLQQLQPGAAVAVER